jgi:50S ribosomal subunit-associated GTPase HflX
MVFNKKDLVDPSLAALHCRLHHGVAISAVDNATLPPLINRLEATVEQLLTRREPGRPEAEAEVQTLH